MAMLSHNVTNPTDNVFETVITEVNRVNETGRIESAARKEHALFPGELV